MALIIRGRAGLAEGWGLRATARVCEVAPNTGRAWRVEAAEPLRAFSRYFLCALPRNQGPRDEWYAVLRAVKDGALRAAEAIQRLEPSPHWGWTALAPASQWLRAIAVGPRTLAMTPGMGHHVGRVLAPDCLPLWLTDGFTEYGTALWSHCGYWVLPERQRAQGPAPQPRGMPRPALL